MNIPKSLAAARKEWERQMEMEKAATPGPWSRLDGYQHGTIVSTPPRGWKRTPQHPDFVVCQPHLYVCTSETERDGNTALIVLSRNRNPVVLKKIGEWLDAVERSLRMAPVEGRLIIEGDWELARLSDILALLQIEAIP